MSKSNKHLTEEFSKLIYQEFSNSIFKIYKDEILTLKINRSFLGWVGFNIAEERSPDSLTINPLIGIRCNDLHKLYSEVMQTKYYSYFPPTVVENIGYFSPENKFMNWFIETGADNQKRFINMKETIHAYGVPFMKSNANLQSICSLLEEGRGYTMYRPFYLPLAYVLLGDHVKAREILDRYYEETKDEDNLWAQHFNDFHNKLINKIVT